MNRLLLVLAMFCFSLAHTTALAQLSSGLGQQGNSPRTELIPGDSTVYLGPIKPNAYGPGIHADATGRASMAAAGLAEYATRSHAEGQT